MHIQEEKLLEAFAEEIRCPNKERSAAPQKSRLILSVYRVKSVTGQIVVVSGVKCRSWAWRIGEQDLAGVSLSGAVIVETESSKQEPREIICRPDAHDVSVE